jgi:hypothetical protein
MKTEQAIRNQTKNLIKTYKYVLNCPLATITENAPRALIQINAIAMLDALYWVLEKERPNFKYDEERYL